MTLQLDRVETDLDGKFLSAAPQAGKIAAGAHAPGSALLDELPAIALMGMSEPGRDQELDGFADQLFFRVTEHGGKPGVGHDDGAGRVHQHHTGWRRLDCTSEEKIAQVWSALV
jgi:hypothetical protein